MISLNLDSDNNYFLCENEKPFELKGKTKEELYDLTESILNFLSFDLQFNKYFGSDPRSGKWETVRKKFILENDHCSCCKTKKILQVHHIEPFHNNPEKELDENNLITLCSTCHFVFGHLKKWHSYNPDVLSDVNFFRKKIEERP